MKMDTDGGRKEVREGQIRISSLLFTSTSSIGFLFCLPEWLRLQVQFCLVLTTASRKWDGSYKVSVTDQPTDAAGSYVLG
ncbi:hypothetical protein RB213_003159 [Colletotrichum asianum]